MTHYLYRHYDAAGRLLYVGITGNLQRRLAQHRLRSPWHAAVASTQAEQHADRAAAEQAEREHIAAHDPPHNKQHSRGHMEGKRRLREAFALWEAALRAAGRSADLYAFVMQPPDQHALRPATHWHALLRAAKAMRKPRKGDCPLPAYDPALLQRRHALASP